MRRRKLVWVGRAGGGNPNDFRDLRNWSPAVVPKSGDSLVFPRGCFGHWTPPQSWSDDEADPFEEETP